MCIKRLFAQDEGSKSIFPTILGYIFSNAVAVAMVPALEITAPQLLSARTNFWMITSSSRKISGRPVFVLYLGIDLLSVVLFSLLSLSFSLHFYLKERTFIEFWKFSLESPYCCCWAMFRGVLSDIITIFITPFEACDFIRWQLYCIDG